MARRYIHASLFALPASPHSPAAQASTARAPVPPPRRRLYRVGDRWVYHGQDGFRVLTTWEETHTISTVDADGITERIT